ncbi:MAG: phosphonate ABC transporter substrate-binding protein [Ruminococcaceae bacterium]|jgi:phosphonate transport system substrate-binding protein|nr:phosphonate ABC transporter substrate-binding protein [Oscillospiraceae bacterium]
MKKALAFLLALLTSLSLLTACGEKGQTPPGGTDGAPAEPKRIDTLRLIFTPSSDPQVILESTEPFKKTLKDELASLGYDVGTVDITVGESYEAVGEALAAGDADVGVGMPGGTYVQYDDACDVILTATRNGLSKDYDDAKDWNDEMPTVSIDHQATFYRSLIIAGPSDAGRALAAKVNAGRELTWEDLDAATWSVMGKTSSAGYIYPALWLEGRYGKGVADLSHAVQSSSYTEAFERLASGEVDVLATYADARIDFALQWDGDFGREVSVWEDTAVIGVTPGIYNDTITVSKSSAVMDDALAAALQDAFIHIASTNAGQAVIAVYDHKGYQKAVSSDYDNERAAQQLLQQLG